MNTPHVYTCEAFVLAYGFIQPRSLVDVRTFHIENYDAKKMQ